MKKQILPVLLITVLIVSFARIPGVIADSLCPAGYTERQCYNYLGQKQQELRNKKSQVDSSLKNVRYQEGDLQAQLDQLNNEIGSKEIEVTEKQVEMEMTSIEIRNIGTEITDAKTKIDTIKQEAQKTSAQINDTVMLTYKVSTVPTWYFFASNDLITTLEMMKYMDYVVKEEKSKLNHFTQLQSQLASEQQSLTNAQSEIISKRDALEKASLDLIKLKNDLQSDSSKKTKLLADLQAMEKNLQAQQSQLKSQQNQYDSETTSLAIKLFQEGRLGKGTPVNKGDVIGFQGHTGCSFGSHLHFGIIQGKNFTSIRANIHPFSSGYLRQSGSYVTSASARAPVNGGLITQGFHEGYALDMVSTSDGNQSGSRYFVAVGSVKCAPSYGNVYHGLRGEGAPVFAILAGTIYRGNTDRWGSNYIIIDHGNGLLSFYFHLK